MTQITASMVQDLREKTGAGMMDCKKALTETDGDFEAAVDFLRKKGLSTAAKKAGRVAAEGVVVMALQEGLGSLVEVNAETDFVARNADFQAFANGVAQTALVSGKSVLTEAIYVGSSQSVAEVLTDKVATIGEHMTVRRSALVKADVVAGYIHGAIAEGMGKIGVLVGLNGADKKSLEEVGKKVAMHIAAAKPECLRIEDVSPAMLERERAILKEQALASGKPESVVEKMMEGRIRKFYEEIVLLEQSFVMDPKKQVKEIVSEAGANLTAYVHFILGEGLEKKSENLAEEVAKQLGA